MKYQFKSWIREKIMEKLGNQKLTGHPVHDFIRTTPSRRIMQRNWHGCPFKNKCYRKGAMIFSRVLFSWIGPGFIHVMENLENLEKYFCHGNVMEFYFSRKVMEMSWNCTKMSWKKYLSNSIIRKKELYILLTIMAQSYFLWYWSYII